MVFETFHYTQQTQLLAEKAQVLPLAQVAAEQHWTDNQYIVTSMFDVPDMGDPKCKDNEHPVVHQPQHQGEVPYSTCEPDTNGNGSKTDCLAIPFLGLPILLAKAAVWAKAHGLPAPTVYDKPDLSQFYALEKEISS